MQCTFSGACAKLRRLCEAYIIGFCVNQGRGMNSLSVKYKISAHRKIVRTPHSRASGPLPLTVNRLHPAHTHIRINPLQCLQNRSTIIGGPSLRARWSDTRFRWGLRRTPWSIFRMPCHVLGLYCQRVLRETATTTGRVFAAAKPAVM